VKLGNKRHQIETISKERDESSCVEETRISAHRIDLRSSFVSGDSPVEGPDGWSMRKRPQPLPRENPMIAFSRVLGHEVAATLMEDVEEIRTPSSTFMRTSSKPSRRRKTCSIRQKAIAVGEAHIDCRAIGGAQCSQDFDHACAVDPRSARAPRRSTASVVRCSRGQTGDATTIFRRNVVLHPEDANVYDSLAEAYMKAGRKNLAISNYEHSLKLNPQNENARTQLKKLHS
jgi:hypothetical protein